MIYLAAGQVLLPPDAWSKHYALAMALAMEHQQCAYLTAHYEVAEAGIEHMLARAHTALEKAEILAMRTRQYATTGKMEASIRSAIMGLGLLGLRISGDPARQAVQREVAAVRRNLAGRRIADLIDAPPLSDPGQKVAIRLLMEIFPASFLSGSGNLFPFLVLKAVNISLRHGNSPESAFAYAAYGMLLCGALDKPALGFEYGQLAVAMNERLDDITLKSRVIYVYTMFVHHWSRHWQSMTPWFRRGIEAGYESGDLLYLAYSAQDCIIWDPTLDLDSAEHEHAEFLGVVRDTGYQDSLDSGTLFLQMLRNFLGRTDGHCSMNDAGFDEQRCLAGMHARKFMTGVANFHIYKAEICWLYGEHAQALVHVRAQEELLASAMSLPQLVRFHTVAFLTRAASLAAMGDEQQASARQQLRAGLQRMSRWAAHCPENFLHLQRLMQAEMARLQGQVDKALVLYEAAIDAASAHEWRRDEAMANELAARHLLAAGRHKGAEGYLRAARHLYQRWGAVRKVEHLESEFASVFELEARGSALADGVVLDAARLDLASVMKASQAISGEIVLEQLWSTTMHLMLENAGGQRGCFVVYKDGPLVIEGLREVGQEAPARASLPLESAEGAQAVPVAILYQVLNSKKALVLHDACAAGPFAREAYVLRHAPRSVLCVPLVRQGRFEGAIYMENRLAAGVFSESRIELINLLAAQVSISLENARLVQDQVRLIDAQARFVPREFLESLNHGDIARVALGENVAKTMSVGFADLRGFTPLAESLDAHSVIGLLNGYFAAMALPISKAGGFIDSFAGDEIKMLFDTSADAALRGAIGMWRALEVFNQRSAALGQPELNMGVGLNTGPVVLGTVGGAERLQCSVIGDTVNLASRIEQLTKVYGARLLIGEATFKALSEPSAFAIRCVDRVAVKGRHVAVALYEVLDAEPALRRAQKLASAPMLQLAMEQYTAREFDAALLNFQKLHEQDAQDRVPPLFIERCQRYRSHPPPADWQGFERMTQK